MSKNNIPLYTMIDDVTNTEIRRRITTGRKMNAVIAEAVALTKDRYPATAPAAVVEVDFDAPKAKARSAKKTDRVKKAKGKAKPAKKVAKKVAKKPAKNKVTKKSPKAKVAKTSK